MELIFSQAVNSLVYAMLLFVLSAGLSLIFGLMNVINIAHGSFFMIGGYVALALAGATGNYWLALTLAPVPAIAMGVVMERVFLRRLYKRGHLDQVLLTFGFTYIFIGGVRWLWGADIRTLAVPGILEGAVEIGSLALPKYRLFIIGVGLALATLLWLLLERSRFGAMVRAGVDDAFTATGLGIDVSLLFSAVFALGVGLSALGGVVAAPVLGVYPGLDAEVLIPSFIVVVVGGLGSLKGAFIASIVVGVLDTLGKSYLPELSIFIVYLALIVVLLTRPQGLCGRVPA
ncbi:MAG: branched-chain amino acid transport system permease protein [Azoarcus sp.]|nr:branched-chain amino acid transport system permease protein [Azoarcus sp.]